MEVSEKRIEEIIHSYQPDRRYALAILQDMQREFQYVPREGMEALAEELRLPGVFPLRHGYILQGAESRAEGQAHYQVL